MTNAEAEPISWRPRRAPRPEHVSQADPRERAVVEPPRPHVPARPRRAHPQEQRQHDPGDRQPRAPRPHPARALGRGPPVHPGASDRGGRAAHPPRLPRPRRRHHPGARRAHTGGAAHPGPPLPEAGSGTMSIHHVSAIAGDPQRNLDFYAGVLGMRLVKLTVNFDDPGSYHLYFGDELGHPGSILTFFPWPDGRRGRQGTGQVGSVSLAVPATSLGYWVERLVQNGIRFDGPTRRFDEQVLAFADPDGLLLEL